MVMILLAGLLAAQLASLWLQWGERASVVSQARGLNFADRVVEVIRVLEAEPTTRREAALATLRARDLQLTLISDDQVSPNEPRGQIQATIAARLGSAREVRSLGGGGSGMSGGGGMMQHGNPTMRRFDVRLKDGQWLRIVGTNEVAAPPALSNDLIVQLLITLLIVAAVVMIAVREATRPLQQLATAADTLGSDLDAPPLAETGPTETRRAAQAFNRMQARIKHLIDERARALAAVSHDLRTPLTRLRLRAELVDDEKLREQMAADLDAMAAMIDATLDYLRGLQDAEVARPIDMNALLQSLAEDAAVLGKIIHVDGNAQSPYPGRLLALRRAVQNLIDNAIKYGGTDGRVDVNISLGGASLCISVLDNGPGIPIQDQKKVFDRFFRGGSGLTRSISGTGLGLSIVRSAAQSLGGKVRLESSSEWGTRVTVTIPAGSSKNG